MEKLVQTENTIRRRVLIVDDEVINRLMLGNILEEDYDILYAENGVQALRTISQNAGIISLVILDLNMPEMDGKELLRVLRKDEMLHKIPVIVLTADKGAEVEALNLGAVDFIPKPFDSPDVIKARVNRSIELAEDRHLILESEKDSLTNLYIRSFFYQYVAQFDRYYPDTVMDAIAININRFHLVNELRGRNCGDQVLRTIGMLAHNFAEAVGGLASRGEGDNFYLYVPHQTEYEHIFKTTVQQYTDAEPDIHINIRMGIYAQADKGISPIERFDRATTACNKLRNTYQSNYCVYDTATHEKELFNERLILEMDQAMEERQFKVYYQPKYSIQGDKPILSSAEALIRWIHPVHGMISPGVFIPLFEENGLIQKLDHYVWNEAARQIKAWQDEYGFSVPVSVNVSRTDIYDPAINERIMDIVETNSLTPHDILLEITESAYTDNSRQIIETVENLRSMGFRVEMDDFGSGYSSLNMLTELPIDALKLDMRFMKNISTDEKDYNMVKIMLDIAKFLQVTSVAEGVETKEQYLRLRDAGCDLIQGYYFSRPIPPEEFGPLMEKDAQ